MSLIPQMLHQLPGEILIHIFSLLPLNELGVKATVCKQFSVLCSDQMLWRYLYIRDFSENIVEETDWREAYRQRVITKICDQTVLNSSKESDDEFNESIQSLKRILQTDSDDVCEREIFFHMFQKTLEKTTHIKVKNVKGLHYTHFFRLLPTENLFHFFDKDLAAILIRLHVDIHDRKNVQFKYLVLEYPCDFAIPTDYKFRFIELTSYYEKSRTRLSLSTTFRWRIIRIPEKAIYFAVRQLFDKAFSTEECGYELYDPGS